MSDVQRLVWLTDIHLNFVDSPLVDDLCARIVAESPDAVLITGDIGESDDVEQYMSRIASRVERPIYFVLGNHDFYHSSIAIVRDSMRRLCSEHEFLRYMTQCAPIELTPTVGLVGHDGWADGRYGDYENSEIFMNDYKLIAELDGPFDLDRRPMLGPLGDEAAAHIRDVLPVALKRYDHVWLLTHFPPFEGACWYEGRISPDDWTPHLACKAMGDVILEIMEDHPHRELTVLCGHTHGEGTMRPLDNVIVHTGGARYGRPSIARTFELA